MAETRKLRAYLVYECAAGWCFEPTKMKADYSDDRPERMHSFSRLSQLLFHLGQRVSKQDKDRANADRSAQQHTTRRSATPSEAPQGQGAEAPAPEAGASH